MRFLQIKKVEMTDILNYMDKLNELDTSEAKEMTHPFDEMNRFRNDEATNPDQREAMLQNAPSAKGDYFKVFKTVE
jgi:aspartyl-tRNA(Asn)/glutamyl-tRNA(Gln) amidotransferase subunit C